MGLPEADCPQALRVFGRLDEVHPLATALSGNGVPVDFEELQEFRNRFRPEVHLYGAQDHRLEEVSCRWAGFEFDAYGVSNAKPKELACTSPVTVGAMSNGDFEQSHVIEQGQPFAAGHTGVMGVNPGQVHSGRPQWDFESPFLPHFLECPLVDVGDEVAKAVNMQDGALNIVWPKKRTLPLAFHPFFDLSSNDGRHAALGQVTGHLNEDVSLWEGLDVAFRVDGDVVDGIGFSFGNQRENAVVKSDEELTAQFHDPVDILVCSVRIDGDEVHRALWEVGNGCAEGEGGMVGVVRSDAVGDVHDVDAGVTLDDGAFDGGCIQIVRSVVGGQCDDAGRADFL